MGWITGPCTSELCSLRTVPPELLGLLLLVLCIAWTKADVVIVRPNQKTEKIFNDYELDFSASLPEEGIKGRVVVSNPPDACDSIDMPPFASNSTLNWFILIEQMNCSLETKVLNAQAAGYQAAIVYNVPAVNTPQTKGSHIAVQISGVLIDEHDGITIKANYTYKTGYTVIIRQESSDHSHNNINKYLLPIAAIIGFSSVLIFFMIIKYIKNRRRNQNNRVTLRHLKHLPITKFKSGDKFEVCAVCLEDFCEGEKLRNLPCSHAFHMVCIDPWLTDNHHNCPICKARVSIPGFSSDSDSESDQDVSETSPLLPHADPSNYQTVQFASESESTGNSINNSEGDRADGVVDRIDVLTVEALSCQARLLCESISGSSSQSGSYQGESSAEINFSPMSTGNVSSSHCSDREENIFPRRPLTLDNRHSINGDDDDDDDDDDEEGPPQRLLVTKNTKRPSRKRYSKLV